MKNTELENFLKIQYKKIEEELIDNAYEGIYNTFNPEEYPYASQLFAYWHKELNDCFALLNEYVSEGRNHFHAENSRHALSVFYEIKTFADKLSKFEILFDKNYDILIENCRKFLQPFGGSTIPVDFSQIELIYRPIFYESDSKANKSFMKDIKLIGEGSYAKVYKYTDDNYNEKFAFKRLNKTATKKEVERFKQEYSIMKSKEYPYVLKVYSFFEKQRMYIMEYMQYNLKNYVETNNNKITFKTRKSIALQVLKGIVFLHYKGILHRDLSCNNILLNDYGDIVVVKLCDFGLAKDSSKRLSSKQTSIKGTYIDPTLSSFSDYDKQNEIYSLGYILWFIFTGKQSYKSDDTALSKIIEKCLAIKKEDRYKDVNSLLADVSSLKGLNSRDIHSQDLDLEELKSRIVDYLSSYSANELPFVCEALGMRTGTVEEAFKGKKTYTERRLYSFNREQTESIIKRIKNNFGIDLNKDSIHRY